jgi:hypothetical protein
MRLPYAFFKGVCEFYAVIALMIVTAILSVVGLCLFLPWDLLVVFLRDQDNGRVPAVDVWEKEGCCYDIHNFSIESVFKAEDRSSQPLNELAELYAEDKSD